MGLQETSQASGDNLHGVAGALLHVNSLMIYRGVAKFIIWLEKLDLRLRFCFKVNFNIGKFNLNLSTKRFFCKEYII